MKYLKFLLFFLLVASVVAPDTASAQRAVSRIAARKFLRRTNVAILYARQQVKENRNFTGDLAKGIAHQKLARRLLMQNKPLRAIHHSRRARLLAIRAIRANKGTVRPEFEVNGEEEGMMGNMPSDEDLDKALKRDMPGESLSDEEVIKRDPDINVEDDAPGRPGKE
ncbi:MAG: hypothetical protein H6585_04820 [Flavobacteriales bacterium]|nr:hypothetical protein [Flavobacteriales bacterium]MCB9447651.1 hypothetical protein [Flavobacteriales bacterium]